MCVIDIDIQTENDLYFAITNTILTLDKEVFTVDYVIKTLKNNNIQKKMFLLQKGGFARVLRYVLII